MPVKIAILCPTSIPWIARVQDGIRLYAQSQEDWHIVGTPPTLAHAGEASPTLRSMKGWKGDGLIIATNEIEELRYAKHMGIPVINLAGGLAKNYGIPRIMTDHYQAGRLAAEHLLERGLPNLAYFGWDNQWYSQQRFLGFKTLAAESKVECKVLLRPIDDDHKLTWEQRIEIISKWLKSLPLPCGIFAVQDYRAQLILEACHESNLRVPNDIAVVGMDNDEIICEHSVPKLSSVTRNAEKIGYLAAELLDRMIHKEANLPEQMLVVPYEVITRESSDTMYCPDPLVRDAIEYMRENLHNRFNIEMIADHLNISKRKLEMRFSDVVNSSPHQYLIRLRIRHAQLLLKLDPRKNIEMIARECGFGTNPAFYSAFQRLTGSTPSAFRSQIMEKEAKSK